MINAVAACEIAARSTSPLHPGLARLPPGKDFGSWDGVARDDPVSDCQMRPGNIPQNDVRPHERDENRAAATAAMPRPVRVELEKSRVIHDTKALR
jgi:hypothetical protein